MPQTIKKYRIFVASPSDVQDERVALSETIAELNITYCNKVDIIFELLLWETHAAPAISQSSVQDIIDADIGSDYDLFIGILWKKFGTPTATYNSGTEQEFQNAYNRFKRDPKSLQILFYFKISPPISIQDIEPLQLHKVNQFKKSLGEKSVLYWEYDTIDELQKFLRIHIPKRIEDLNTLSVVNIKNNLILSNNTQTTQDEELGLLDYQEIYIDSFADCGEALKRLSEATTWVGKEIRKKTDELNLIKSLKQEIGKKESRDFYNRTAEIMNDYASRLEPEIPIYINNFERGANAFTNIIALYRSDFKEQAETEYKTSFDVVLSLITGIETGYKVMKEFLDAISNLPRMAKELNKARSNLENKLKELLSKLEISKSIASELLKDLL